MAFLTSHLSFPSGHKLPTGLVLVQFDEVVNNPVVEVLASQVGITGSGQHLRMPSPMERSDTSKVPPLRLQMII